MALGGWETKFNNLFTGLQHSWNLEVVKNVDGKIGWSKMHCKGKATFECSNDKCKNKWPCVNSGLVFYYRLTGFGIEQHGEVNLFIGGQKCMQCKDVFEYPQWSDSELELAIEKILNEIKQKVYGETESSTLSSEEEEQEAAAMASFHQNYFGRFCELCILKICQPNIEEGPSQFYPMEQPRGFALIINVKSFFGTIENGETLSEREGSDIDAMKLKNLWEKLGFTVEYDAANPKAHEIITAVQDVVEKINKQQKCFVCCIMTHGRMGRIYGSDSKHLDIEDIIIMLKEKTCEALKGKPKLFFIQACRGLMAPSPREAKQQSTNDDSTLGSDLAGFGMQLKGSPSEGDLRHLPHCYDNQFRICADPDEPHFLLGYSTASGLASFRSIDEGTLYISALVKVFSKYHQFYDVLEMMSEVTNIVSKKCGEYGCQQCPAPISTLTKKVRL